MTDKKQRAIVIARRLFPELVHNMAALEGNQMTLEEVRTLLAKSDR